MFMKGILQHVVRRTFTNQTNQAKRRERVFDSNRRTDQRSIGAKIPIDQSQSNYERHKASPQANDSIRREFKALRVLKIVQSILGDVSKPSQVSIKSGD